MSEALGPNIDDMSSRLAKGLPKSVRQLVESGRFDQAVEELAAEMRRAPVDAHLARLVPLRHAAFENLPKEPGSACWPPPVPDLFPHCEGVPEIEAGAMTAETLASGIHRHGCLIVRQFLSADDVALLVADIDRAFEAADRKTPDTPVSETLPWFAPLRVPPESERGYPLHYDRYWAREGGAVYLADSPRTLMDVLDLFEAHGLIDVLTTYLGERPALSVKKTALRKVRPDSDHNWHQDGAFLGEVRAVNTWLALSNCGTDAPSLDIVARRIDELATTGTGDAAFKWSVGSEEVARVANGTPIVRPQFRAGDALFFDERNLHRTGVSPGMTRERYAIESWFFAPSSFPLDQVPLAI